MEDDLLSANMIVNKYGIIGSSNINNKTKEEIRNNFPFFMTLNILQVVAVVHINVVQMLYLKENLFLLVNGLVS